MSVRQPGGGSGPAIGGQINDATNGSVVFVNPDNTLAQDNQNFFFDNTNDRLAVFTTLGTEVLTNPTITGSAAGWTVPSGMAYSSNTIVKNSNGTGALTQTNSPYVLREYLIEIIFSSFTAGSVTVTFGGVTHPDSISTAGTHYRRIVVTAATGLSLAPTNTARFTLDSASVKPLKGTNTKANINTGGLSLEGEWSNGSPGTTRPMTINNDGSYSWIDYRFQGVLKGATVVNSSGEVGSYQSGGSGVTNYACNSGLTSCSLYQYSTATALVHSGGGYFNTGVMAGAQYAPTSTLQTKGGLGLEVKRITASQTLDNTATHWLCDATTAAACTGTPSAACSSWNNQTDCEKWDAHGGCTWFAGTSCSIYDNESGMGSCSGQAGCTVVTASCSGAGDQTACESQDDAYGGSCSWGATGDCSPFDEATCGSYAGQCTQNYGDCSAYSDGGGDGSACAAYNAGCSYDSGTGACTGTPYLNCSGNYNTCSGTYNTGTCSGTFGAACSGTSTCSGIDDSTNCGLETGCTWSSVLNATLPSMATYPHRTYWVKNQAAVANTALIPAAGETVNGASSYTIRNTDSVHVAPYHDSRSCSEFLTAGACTPTGCSVVNANCSWNSGDNTCSGDAGSVCSAHNGNQTNCEAQTYFSYCSGTYTVTKDWHVWSEFDKDETLFTQTASVTVANTTTETTLIGSGVGSATLPAGYLQAGKTIKIKMMGYHSSTGSPLITMKVKLGSTVILTTGTHSSHNDTNKLVELTGLITCRSTGASGTVFGQGVFEEVGATLDRVGMVNTGTSTVDTTTTQALSITVTWGTANAGNTLTATNIVLEASN